MDVNNKHILGGSYMRKINRLICINIVVIFVFSLMVSSVFAFNEIEKVMESDNISMAIEKEEINNSIESSDRWIRDSFKGQEVRIDLENAYKVYNLDSFDFYGDYKKNSTIEGIIGKEYFWEIPIKDSNDSVISSFTVLKGRKLEDIKKHTKLDTETENELKKIEGKWHVSGIGSNIPISSVSYLSNKPQIESFLKQEDINNVNSFKVLNVPSIFGYAIYLKTNKAEYIIPFSKREDLFNIKNSTLYTVSEFVDILGPASNTDPNSFGGISANAYKNANTSNYNFGLIVILIAGILLIASAIIIIRVRKKRIYEKRY